MNIDNIKLISEEEAKKRFNFNCPRFEKEYRKQQLATLSDGKYEDLLYQTLDGWNYLTSRKI